MDFTSEDFRKKEPMIREWILTHPNEPETDMMRTLLDEISYLHGVAESYWEQANGEGA